MLKLNKSDFEFVAAVFGSVVKFSDICKEFSMNILVFSAGLFISGLLYICK